MDKEQLIAELETAKNSNNNETFESLARQAVEQYPEEALGYLFLADALGNAETPNYGSIELCLAKGIELDDENVEAKVKFGQIKEEQGLLADARLVYRKVLKQDEDNAIAIAGLGRYEIYEVSDGQAAIEYFDKAIGLDPENKQNYIDRAAAHIEGEQWQLALDDLDRGASGEFNEDETVMKISALNWLGRSSEADSLYQDLIKHSPEVFTYRYNYGKELLDRSKFAEAAEQLSKAASLTEDADSTLYRPLGQALFSEKDYNGALENFDKCVEENGEDIDAYIWRADSKMQLGQNENALDDLNKALGIIAGDEVLERPVLAQKGLVLAELSRWDEAEPIFMKLAKSGMGKREGFYGLGVVYHKQGNMESAYKFMKAARLSKHPKAKAYIEENLGAYVQEIQESVLGKYEGAFAANATSAASKLFGTLWKFKSIDSKKLSAAPPKFADKIKESLAVFSAIVTERGVLLISEQKEEAFTYKVTKEKGSTIEVELAPLDGLPSSSVKFTVADGKFAFSREEGEVLNLVPQDLGSIPAALKATILTHVEKSETTYLGDKAQAIVDALF
ncbi:MAG: tetratricopeptide repeat protein [Aureispira sp.]|nr:tetratricopeptide repeat protein [Aureispira sp.]